MASSESTHSSSSTPDPPPRPLYYCTLPYPPFKRYYFTYSAATARPHPIHRLPPELLAEIFFCYISTGVPTQSFHRAAHRRGVMLPSHVCRKWRAIALATPRLWYLNIFGPRTSANTQTEVDCTRTWLSRSGQCPLTIRAVSGQHDALNVAMELLVPHCTRWREVTLDPVPPDLKIMSPIKGNLPILEFISLLFPTELDDDFDAFEVAPKLRHLHLYGHFQLNQIRVPWDQLTHCETIVEGGDPCLEMLVWAPNLQHFQVLIYQSLPCSVRSPLITHTSLSTILLDGCLPHFLDQLILPALSDLLMTVWDEENIASLLSRSACTLKTLTISIYGSNEHDIMELLQRAPGLQVLELTFNTTAEWSTILEALKLSFIIPEHLFIVPKLRRLIL